MKKSNMLVLVFTTMLLIVCTISMSFAWYSAEVLDNMINNLASEGVNITLSSDDTKLQPIVMNEGVIIPEYNGYESDGYVLITSGYVAPSDWNTNENYYSSLGTTYEMTNEMKVVVDKLNTLTLSFTVTYYDSLGNEVVLTGDDLALYFNLSYTLSNSGEILEGIDGLYTMDAGTYELDFEISVSYSLPDELLPIELVNSKSIVLNITANLS